MPLRASSLHSASGRSRKTFDPFAPHWLFLVGYLHVYVIQAISYHDYALRARGVDLVTSGQWPGALGALVVSTHLFLRNRPETGQGAAEGSGLLVDRIGDVARASHVPLGPAVLGPGTHGRANGARDLSGRKPAAAVPDHDARSRRSY